MPDHFVSLARGVQGFKYSDFTTGIASNATALFEIRISDGVVPKPSKTEVLVALEAFERFFENAQQVAASGFDVKG